MTPQDLGESPAIIDTDVFSFVVWNRGPYEWYEPFLENRHWVLSFATVGELRYGALKAGWGRKRRDELERRIRLCTVIPGGDVVATKWSELHRNFANQISDNDLWIAASALSQDPILPLITNDATLDRVATAFKLTVVRKL